MSKLDVVAVAFVGSVAWVALVVVCTYAFTKALLLLAP